VSQTHNWCITLWSLILLGLSTVGRTEPSPQQPAPPLVFMHVTVIDATGAPPQPDMTVVITGDRIAEIGLTQHVRIPDEAHVVDATGKFLIPGLWDMHVHWNLTDFLPLFIANGVTGVRLMWGMPLHHTWRQDIERGTLLGPRMSIASPIVDGPNPIWPGSMVVRNAAEGRQAVTQLQQAGAEFIKVYSLLPRDAYFAIADEARQQGLPFAGHVPYAVSAAEAAEAGQHSIEHLTGILEACSTREEEVRRERVEAFMRRAPGQRLPNPARLRPLLRMMLETFSPEKATALFARLKHHQTWQCPTLTVLRSSAFLDDPTFRNDPRLKYMPAQIRTQWEPATDFRFQARTEDDFALARLVYQKQVELVGMMHRAGVEVLAGTDVLNPYCFPGFSLHDELELLVQAGLTPLEALQAATRNPARFLGKETAWGTVEQGKMADVVLLDANPLENIRHTRAIRAVVLNGRLLDRPTLDALLAQAEAAAQVAPEPLPDDVTIVVPTPDVPPAMAAFSGRWAGQWGQTLDHVLVVEKIDGQTVTFIYSWGVAPAWNITTPGFRRVHGTIGEDGVLRGTLGNGAEVAYTLSQDQQTLSGTYVLGGRTTRGRFTRQ
jgi:imidazolonepropionase-like amidohydrolase